MTPANRDVAHEAALAARPADDTGTAPVPAWLAARFVGSPRYCLRKRLKAFGFSCLFVASPRANLDFGVVGVTSDADETVTGLYRVRDPLPVELEVAAHFGWLAGWVAHKYARRLGARADVEELKATAEAAALGAVIHFRAGAGSALSTWVTNRIRHRLANYTRQHAVQLAGVEYNFPFGLDGGRRDSVRDAEHPATPRSHYRPDGDWDVGAAVRRYIPDATPEEIEALDLELQLTPGSVRSVKSDRTAARRRYRLAAKALARARRAFGVAV